MQGAQRVGSVDGSPQGLSYEGQMRAGLSTVSWSKVGVAFRSASTLTPLAHNKLPALRRDGWRRVFEWIEGTHEGQVVVEHAARFIVDSLTTSRSSDRAE